MPQRKAKRKPSTPATAGKRSPVATEERSKNLNWSKLAMQGGILVVVAAFIYFIASGVGSEVFGAPEGVQAVAVDDPQHVEGEIEYEGQPAGGAHSSVWLNCGAYGDPVAEENAVHSLEHGAVWITYPAGASSDVVDRLEGYSGPNKVIVSPVVDQTTPIIVTSWANQMEVDTPDDPRIAQYIVEFAGAASAPEPGGLCSGGIGQPG